MIYLNIGQRRIQAYLNRSRKLKLRRGASEAITIATSNNEVETFLKKEKLASAVEINKEAGEVDGVIHLKLNGGESDPSMVASTISVVASTIVNRHLRRRLPSGEFEAVYHDGSSYLDAYEKMSQKRERGDVLTFLAPIFDLPMVVPCVECKTDPKMESTNGLDLCRDCDIRNSAAGDRSFESKLVKGFKQYGIVRPKHFDELAKAEILATDDDHNSVHKPRLATVFADGNMIGAELKKLNEKLGGAATQAVPDEQRRAIQGIVCKVLHDATELSVKSVVSEMVEPKELAQRGVSYRGESAGKEGAPKFLPIVPHVVGGDDVLVTVPARLGWFFAVRFLRTFQDTVANEYQKEFKERLDAPVPENAILGEITASAGLVFHHFSEPFDSVTGLSESLLRSAKSFTGGKKASIAWQDITQDGRMPLFGNNSKRRCWRLADLECPLTRQELAFLSDRRYVSNNTYSELVTLMTRRADIVESGDEERIKEWEDHALNRMRRQPELRRRFEERGLDCDAAVRANLVETAGWWSTMLYPCEKVH